ncbi:MAG TPA: HlyD family secretion protein [Gemmatimonadales bacterium]|nr:HlyD family secretion protein [Gemmatimonadales bacterium]
MSRVQQLLRKRWYLVAGAIVLVVSGWVFAGRGRTSDPAIVATVAHGPFSATVTTSGELRAKESVQITAPAGAMQVGAWQMRISSLVPEGTIVKTGDVVAELDRSTLGSRLSDVNLALQKAQAQYEEAMLDSALTLSTAREAIQTAQLDLDAKRLAKEQAVYEAPTVKRQTEIDLDRAQRALTQSQSDLETHIEQAKAKMREMGTEVERQHNLQKQIQDVLAGFTVKAPSPGMVIYVREWNGKKRTAGSQVYAYEPSVATLPDLTHMESVTYVNEIDVRRVAVGQPVQITLDADPTRHLTGVVASVANVGEQRPNTDAKVFEVHVTVLQSDTTLRPGMTTGNAIETLHVPDALSMPLEAMFTDSGTTFAYRQSGGGAVKQEIVPGAMNDYDVVVARGLSAGDRVLMTPPADAARLKLVRLPATAHPSEAAASSTRAAGALGDTATTPPPPRSTPHH